MPAKPPDHPLCFRGLWRQTSKPMKKQIVFILISMLCCLGVSAQTITVKQDGSGDFTSIQQAIDSAANYDTVLVYPGVYYEHLKIEYKNIVLGSLTLTTGDKSYIRQTIIDGGKTEQCIRVCCSTDTVIVNGFEIRNGYAIDSIGYNSFGGGIYILHSYAKIYNCYVHHNLASSDGGGINILFSDVFLSGTTISDNHAYYIGGGITIGRNDTVVFDPVNRCNIYNNYAAIGTDMMGKFTEIFVDTFTVVQPDYYYIHIPNEFQDPIQELPVHINAGKTQPITQNIYVSPLGDDSASGLSPDDPFKTISWALIKIQTDTLTPDTVFLANGNYSDTLTDERFPLSLKRDVSIVGANRDSCILDGEDNINLMHGIWGAYNYTVKDLTIKNGNGDKYSYYSRGGVKVKENDNATFKNISFTNNLARITPALDALNSNNFHLEDVLFKNNIGGRAMRTGHGDITELYYDTVYLYNCIFEENMPDYSPEGGFGGGLDVIVGELEKPNLITAVLYNNLFIKNHSKYNPEQYTGPNSTAISVYQGAHVFLINCTFADNLADNLQGGNIGVVINATLDCYNSIFFNNEPVEFYLATDYQGPSKLNIYNSLVEGGEEEIRLLSDNVFVDYDEETNIDTDPLFYGGPDFPYNLSDNSPCIDAGTTNLPQFILDKMPDIDLAGNPRIVNNSIDMGCYEWNPTVGTVETTVVKTPEPKLKVYPNPFVSQTTVYAKWDKQAGVAIEIYNNAGLLVKTLKRGRQLPGLCQIPWNGTDNNSNHLPAGVYYVVLRIDGEEMESMKIVKF